ELRQKVFEITGRKPCEKWVKRFLNKNPSISPYNTRPLDPKRARAFNSCTVNGFFDLLEKVIIDYEIPMENIYNTDEKGLQLGGGRRSSLIQRIYETGSKDRYILKGDSLTLITIIEAVCADGTLCPPGIIMPPGATGDWMSVEGLGCFTQSANGWTDNYICHQWFEKCFIPFATTRNTSGKPILLISDGHQSHETPEMRLLAFENLVILLSLPPKTTHKLQPLDVGVFGPFQRAWTRSCENWAIEQDCVTRYNVVSRYMMARNETITEKIIRDSFKHTGIWPINSNVFSERDFAPSLTFSTTPSLPTYSP
ncbi:hypothetical protein M422DRAFT_120754, partial [Sphaerobolus stellatus SS14]